MQTIAAQPKKSIAACHSSLPFAAEILISAGQFCLNKLKTSEPGVAAG
jgi:hypothetical protein